MATPMHVRAEIAARYGGIDPYDDKAMDKFYAETIASLSARERDEISMELLLRDGEPNNEYDDRKIEESRRKPRPPFRLPPRVPESVLASVTLSMKDWGGFDMSTLENFPNWKKKIHQFIERLMFALWKIKMNQFAHRLRRRMKREKNL